MLFLVLASNEYVYYAFTDRIDRKAQQTMYKKKYIVRTKLKIV